MRDYSKQTKPTPEKYCAYCGKKMERKRFPSGKPEGVTVFLKRKYCDRMCMRKAFVKTNGEQIWGPAHHSARSIMYLVEKREKKCELCGSDQNIDVHHKDGNFNNNSEENLMLVCRSCHMKIHRKPKETCVLCGKPTKGHGYCNAHYIRWKKYGDPLHYYHHQVEPSFFQGRIN